MSSPPARAFGYKRRSQDREDRQVLSVDSQHRVTNDLSRANNLDTIHLPAESQSAHHPGRPIFNDMLERIRRSEARYIVCWRVNRLARNPTDAGALIQLMDDGKLLAVFSEERVYRCTSRDKHDLWTELGGSKRFSDDISDNVKVGYQTKYERGEYPTQAFTGYKNIVLGKDGQGNWTRNIAPDEVQGPKVKELLHMAMTGSYTLDDLYKHACTLALITPRGRLIKKSSLFDLLRRKAYAGTYWHGGAWRVGRYEALISMDEYDQVQMAMGWARKRRHHSPHDYSRPYKGVVRCGECGYNITGYTKDKLLASGINAQYHFYVCTRKSKTVKCKNPPIKDVDLTAELARHVAGFNIGAKNAAECLAYISHFKDETVNKRQRYNKVWEEDITASQQALNILDENLEKGVISGDRYKARAAHHEAVIAKAKQQLSDNSQNAERWFELDFA